VLDLLTRPGRDGRFFSLTTLGSYDGFSLVIDSDDFSVFNSNERRLIVQHSQQWRAIQFNAGEGGVALGAVSELSAALALGGVSIYYLSSSVDDFILVQQSEVEKALGLLRSLFNSH